MNSDQIKGRLEEAKGAVKQTVGETLNDASLQVSGAADKIKGKAQSTYGDAKQTVQEHHDQAMVDKGRAQQRNADEKIR